MKKIFGGLAIVMAYFVGLGDAQSGDNSSGANQMLATLQESVPLCAFNCIVGAITNSNCLPTDTNCICTDLGLAADTQICLVANCTVMGQLETAKFQKTSCGEPVHNIGNDFRLVTWVLYSFATIFVIGRLFSRLSFVTNSNFSWDDWTIIIAWVGLTAVSAVANMLAYYGMGQDIWMLNAYQITQTLKHFYIAEWLYSFTLFFTKVSILLLYLRIFPQRTFRIQCYTLIAVAVLHVLGSFISNIFYCKPLSFVWEGWDGQHVGTCGLDTNAQTYSFGSINITLDLCIFFVPIPQLIPLQMSWKRKLGISLMFLVGLFETICSVIRMWTITIWGKSTNPTYDYASLGLWSVIELDVGVICACMPGMAAVLRRMLPRVFGTAKTDSNSKSSKMTPPSNSMKDFNRIDSLKRETSKNTNVSGSFGSRKTPKGSESDEFELIYQEP